MAAQQPNSKQPKQSADAERIPKPGMHLYVAGATSADENQLPTQIAPPTATTANREANSSQHPSDTDQVETETGAASALGTEESRPTGSQAGNDREEDEVASGSDSGGVAGAEGKIAQLRDTDASQEQQGLANKVASAVLALAPVRRLYRPRFIPVSLSRADAEGDYVHLDSARSRCRLRLGISPNAPVLDILTQVADTARQILRAGGWQDPFVEVTAVACEEP